MTCDSIITSLSRVHLLTFTFFLFSTRIITLTHAFCLCREFFLFHFIQFSSLTVSLQTVILQNNFLLLVPFHSLPACIPLSTFSSFIIRDASISGMSMKLQMGISFGWTLISYSYLSPCLITDSPILDVRHRSRHSVHHRQDHQFANQIHGTGHPGHRAAAIRYDF